MFQNKLLVGAILGLVAYWAVGLAFMNSPVPILSTSISIFLILAGAMALARFGPTGAKVLFQGMRSEEDDGSYLAALGVSLIALGVIYGGIYSIVWNYFGTPQEWIGTPFANFGRALTAAGFVCMFLSPDTFRDKIQVPSLITLFFLILMALSAAFVLGTQFSKRADNPTLLGFKTDPVCMPQSNIS